MTTRASYLLLLGSCSMVSACDDPPIVASPRGSTTVALLAEGFCGYLSRCCTLGELNRIIPFAGDTQCAERLVEYTSLGNGIDLGMRELLNVELELTLPNPGALQEVK